MMMKRIKEEANGIYKVQVRKDENSEWETVFTTHFLRSAQYRLDRLG